MIVETCAANEVCEVTQESHEAAEKKAKKYVDNELSALRKISAILESLSESAKSRVLNYLANREIDN